MLEVKALCAGYDQGDVLHALDLSVRAGEIVCLIGANGAGKSSTMRAIVGLLRPLRGEILLNGVRVEAATPDRIVAAGCALVPEGRRVFAPMSVAENLEMGAYQRLKRGERDEVARDREFVLNLFPRLEERLEQPAGTLSGGEQQMLAIGRALMARPSLLLLDEPSMGLAPLVVKDIFRTIADLNQAGATVLLAEQNASAALKIAERAYVLAEGRIARSGSAADLKHDPTVRETYLGV
ncbi:MAG: ABC transporter ATP-binding protein [Alphaproteobacteria bacterium]|nr:ABC transporter ATP-binding protein [Alphaproteobacteria bacterium]